MDSLFDDYVRMVRDQDDPVKEMLSPEQFIALATAEVRRAIRYERPLCVALMEIDTLTAIRAAEGAEVAESVLGQVALHVAETLRVTDWTSRIGGDRLGVLLPETTVNRAVQAAERLCAAVAARPFMTVAGPHAATLSVGLATVSNRLRDPANLLLTADLELGRARHEGRNRVCVAIMKPMRPTVANNGRIH